VNGDLLEASFKSLGFHFGNEKVEEMKGYWSSRLMISISAVNLELEV
jgi:hypothetical protein